MIEVVIICVTWYLLGLLSIPIIKYGPLSEDSRLTKKDILLLALCSLGGPLWLLYVTIPSIAIGFEE